MSVAREGRRNNVVVPFTRALDLGSSRQQEHRYSRCLRLEKEGHANSPHGCLKDPYQSPLLSPLARELDWSLFVFPAAADAKLDVNGEGIAVDCCRYWRLRERGSIGWGLRISLCELRNRLGCGDTGSTLPTVNRG